MIWDSSITNFGINLAVVIAINEYQNGIHPLNTAVNDAKKLADLLETKYNYQVLRLFPLENNQNESTLENINKLLCETLPQKIQSPEVCRLLFYFAGHGIARNGENGPAGYLVPQNAQLGKIETFLPMQTLYKALTDLSCHHLLVILDCCFAGTFRWSSTRNVISVPDKIHKEHYDRFIRHPAWQAITSAAHNQEAIDFLTDQRGVDLKNKQHSPFAMALIEALQDMKADLTKDGVITAPELYIYLRDEVEKASSESQTPGLWPLHQHDRGEYIFTPLNFNPEELKPAPEPNENNNPYRGLKPFEEKHSRFFFGRDELVQQLYDKVATPDRVFTVVLGISGSGKSSLVKAGLIPLLRQKSKLEKSEVTLANQWEILAPMRPGESPFLSLARTILPIANVSVPTQLAELDFITEVVQEKIKILETEIANSTKENGKESQQTQLLQEEKEKFSQFAETWNSDNQQSKLLLLIQHYEELYTLCKSAEEQKSEQQIQESSPQKLLKRTFLATLNPLSQRLQSDPNYFIEIVTDWSQQHPGFKLLLVIDQFEELITLSPPTTGQNKQDNKPQEWQLFLNLLETTLGANLPQQRIVVTLRSDFEPRFLNSFVLKSYWSQAKFPVRAMRSHELRQAIEGPASEMALYFEPPNLVDRLIDEVGQMPGALPLLSFTLSELYLKLAEKWKDPKYSDRALRIEDYNQLGGVAGALTRQATEKYNSLAKEFGEALGKAHQATMRRVMLRMVTIEQGRVARRRVPESELVYSDSEENERVVQAIDRLVKAHLLVKGQETGEPYTEPAHDFLVQEWDKLQTWINQNQKALVLQQRLTPAVNDWLNNKQAPGFLWDEDPRIELLENLQQSDNKWLNEQETKFVKISIQQRSDKLRDAERRAKISLSGQLAAQSLSNLNSHFDLALLLGVEANRVIDTAEARSCLLSGLQHTPQLTAFLRRHTAEVLSVAFNPDGKTLASGSADSTIVLWDVDTRQAIGQLLIEQNSVVSSLAYSPDGKILASGTSNGTIIMWDTATHKPIDRPLNGHSSSVRSLAFSPDGKILASASSDRETLGDLGSSRGIILLWNVTTRQLIGQPFTGHIDRVRSLAFSPDGKTLASGSCGEFHPSGICKRGEVRLWDIAAQQQLRNPLTDDDINRVETIAFSPDGKIVAGGDTDGIIILWDVVAGERLGKPLIGHTDSVFSVVFSPDSQKLASGSKDKSIILWNVEALQRIDQLTGHTHAVYSIAFSPDGKKLVSGSEDSTVILWDITASQRLGKIFIDNTQSLDVVAFSPNGEMLASGGSSSHIVLWDVSTRLKVGELLATPDSNIKALAFSGDSQILASGDTEGIIMLWDVNNRQKIGQPLLGDQQGEWVTSLAFSENSQIFASGSHDQTVILWDVATQQPLGQPLTGHQSWVYSVAFSRDSQILASGDSQGIIILWDVRTRQQIGQPIAAHARELHSVAFSPDGKILASGGSSIPAGRESNLGEIRLWDVTNGKQLGRTLAGHTSTVSSIAFSSDGKTLASSSWDGTIILWDVATGQPLGRSLIGHSGIVSNIAFSPDGRTLVSGSYDQTIILWDVSLEMWQNYVCNIVARNLTSAEWAQYFPDREYHKTCSNIPVHPSVIEDVLSKAKSEALAGNSKAALFFYTQAVQWAIETDHPKLNNDICWYGTIDGFPEVVLPACQRAVDLAPNIGIPYDSRGLARTLTGNYTGAIEDFKFYLQWLKENHRSEWKQQQWQAWITELEAGINPFDLESLKTLRD